MYFLLIIKPLLRLEKYGKSAGHYCEQLTASSSTYRKQLTTTAFEHWPRWRKKIPSGSVQNAGKEKDWLKSLLPSRGGADDRAERREVCLSFAAEATLEPSNKVCCHGIVKRL